MKTLAKGTLVNVTQIVGLGVPLPLVGVVEYLTNSPGDMWYAVRIKWVDHINEICPTCRQAHYKQEKYERLCDVHRDWMTVLKGKNESQRRRASCG